MGVRGYIGGVIQKVAKFWHGTKISFRSKFWRGSKIWRDSKAQNV